MEEEEREDGGREVKRVEGEDGEMKRKRRRE